MKRRNRRLGRPQASRKLAAPFRCRLVIMAKMPVMGRVKTRLGRTVGAVAATRFYRHTLTAVVGRLRPDPRWQTILAVAPDTGVGWPGWPHHVQVELQGPGDLGRRMQRIMDRAAPGPVLIVGTDIPAIAPCHIAQAFRLCRQHGAVLGPATDGGYWLVGLARSPRIRQPFADVRWSTADARADTAANLAPLKVGAAQVLADVDDAAELAACTPRFGRRVLPVPRA